MLEKDFATWGVDWQTDKGRGHLGRPSPEVWDALGFFFFLAPSNGINEIGQEKPLKK